jgi:hypothetical protein
MKDYLESVDQAEIKLAVYAAAISTGTNNHRRKFAARGNSARLLIFRGPLKLVGKGPKQLVRHLRSLPPIRYNRLIGNFILDIFNFIFFRGIGCVEINGERPPFFEVLNDSVPRF